MNHSLDPRMILVTSFIVVGSVSDPGTQTFPEQIFAYRPNILGVLIETLSMFAPSGRNPYLTLVMYSVVHLLKFSVDAYVAEFQ